MIVRYLAAFGPASVKDMQTWSGLTGLREAVAPIRDWLISFRDENGNELFDVADAPRPDADVPAPPRFLSEFDNMLLSYADRTRILSEAYKKLVFTNNGIIRATFLIDGFVRGKWSIERRRGAAELTIEPFEPLTKPDKLGLETEGERLLRFAEGDAETYSVRFFSP